MIRLISDLFCAAFAVGDVDGGDDDSDVAEEDAEDDDDAAVAPVPAVPVEAAEAAPLREEWRGSDEASRRTERHSSAHSRSLSVSPYC